MASVSGWKELGPPARPPAAGFAISPFARLARTQAFLMAGDALVTLALAGSLFFSISPTAARGRVILSLVLTMAPFAIVAPLLGPAIDRSRAGRRTMIVATALGRAAACVVMIRVLDGLWLFPAAFAVLVLSKTYSVSKSALVPAVVDNETMLVEANSKLAMLGVIAGFVASIPGIALLRFAGAEWTLGLAAACFVAGGIVAMRLPSIAIASADAAAPQADADVAAGEPAAPVHAVSLHLTAAAVATALLRAMVGFLTFLVAFGFRRAGAASWEFGVVLAASVAANFIGAALAPIVRARLREEHMLVAALGCVGAVGVAVARLDGMMWAVAVAAAVGFAAGAGKLAFDAVVQRDAHATIRGRSFARFEAGFQLVWVVGALLPVIVATPLRQGFDVLGIAGVAGAVAYALATRRLGRAAA